MHLSQILLVNFRNYEQFSFIFDEQITIFLGPNGIGKTNILEAVHLLSLGNTFRDNKIEELVKLDQEVSHVGGKVIRQSDKEVDPTELQLTLTRGMFQSKRVSKRRFQINHVSRTKSKFIGNLVSVCFRPEDLRIVEGSPARRRKYLDETISQIDTRYETSLATYSKALRSRNKILEMIREGKTSRSSIEYYDQAVIEHGSYLHQARSELVEYCNQSNHYPEFGLSLEYDHSVISRERLDQYRSQELAAGYTLVGPHRDDIKIQLQATSYEPQASLNLATYGSRGQQRMGVLWLKLMALEYLSEKLESDQRPLLLLDDIFSELDQEHRQLVFDQCQKQQTIITTADDHYLKNFSNSRVVDLGAAT